MVFTSIPASYFDAANWQQQVNNRHGFLRFVPSYGFFVQRQKISKHKTNILVTFAYASS